MSPEAANYLAKAHEDLDDAKKMAAIALAKPAARTAYYAAFHAAEAFVTERTGKVAKTHSGVRTEMARLLRSGHEAERVHLAFLAQAYKYKEISDYGVGLDATLSTEEALEAIDSASAFIHAIEQLIG